MIGRKDALKAEMKEIKDLIDLYIQANPDYKRKGVEEKKETPVVVTPTTANVEQAFTLLAKVLLLNQFNSKHGGVISHSGCELCCFSTLANRFGQLHSAVSDLDLTRFETESKSFASAFTALSARSSEKLCSK